MGKIKVDNFEVEKANQNKLRELEQFYVTNKVDDLMKNIETRKKEVIQKMEEYVIKHEKATEYDSDGFPSKYIVDSNPLVINNYFFKSIVPLGNQEPIYNAEKLAIVFDYYCDILAEVNDRIGDFPSSLTSFCKLAGITLNTLKSYKNSADYSMRVIAEKIYDQIGDENITMAQLGRAREKSTIFKMKAQNELIEKVQPNVNINIKAPEVDLDRINERLEMYKNYTSKVKKESKRNGK
jgi:hypothetical protein